MRNWAELEKDLRTLLKEGRLRQRLEISEESQRNQRATLFALEEKRLAGVVSEVFGSENHVKLISFEKQISDFFFLKKN